MEEQDMHLNIRIDLAEDVWEKVIPSIYKEMDGWIGFAVDETNDRNGLPHWFSFNDSEKHIFASIEAGGIHFSGLMNEKEWNEWKVKIKKIATEKLGYTIGEIELGEVEE